MFWDVMNGEGKIIAMEPISVSGHVELVIKITVRGL